MRQKPAGGQADNPGTYGLPLVYGWSKAEHPTNRAATQTEKGGVVTVERFVVEEGAILLFARAVGDPNPIYSDRAYAAASEVGGIIAPPTFVQSSAQFDPNNPLRPRPGQPWHGSGRQPTGRVPSAEAPPSGTSLHAEQHYQYHRPLRAGDVLSSTSRPGERWEKQGRSGRLIFTESVTEYRDQDDEVVVTARTVAVLTEGAAEAKEA